MIQPHEEVPGERGHPAWKLNVFAAIIVCVIGIAMLVSVSLMVYGAVVLAVGVVWGVIACIVGMMQERATPSGEHLSHP
jgi:uncharacterized membrane protein